jgi:RNase adaptor protein for sRNA GlmZ degradation
MIKLELTEEELNTVLHGLYLLEDQSWFIGKNMTNKLINKLNRLDKEHSITKEVICDI